jgi:hypothetical protein
MDLSRYDIAFGDSGYHVIDWLHGVSTEELPAGQEILEEIGAHLRALHSQDWIGAKNQFLYIFMRSQNRDGYVPYHAQQTALSELIAINEQI